MHGSAGLHSAMAIKRARRQREQAKRRALERRLSSRTESADSIDFDTTAASHAAHQHRRRSTTNVADNTLVTSVGMLHIGVCFLVLGLFLIGSGLLPDDMATWRGGSWWNELVATGIFVAALGIFLIAMNRVVAQKEEQNLEEYVNRQLTRSRSGHRLERDIETGGLTTKHHRRHLEQQRSNTHQHAPVQEQTHVIITHERKPAIGGDLALEKILEEEQHQPGAVNGNVFKVSGPDEDISPVTPSDTRELLQNGRQYCFNSREY